MTKTKTLRRIQKLLEEAIIMQDATKTDGLLEVSELLEQAADALEDARDALVKNVTAAEMDAVVSGGAL